MGNSLEYAVREHLAAYLQGEVSLDELKSWLVSMTWDRSEPSDIEGMRLANEIKLSLAEHSGGFMTDDLLRDDLVGIFNRVAIDPDVRKIGATGTANLPTKVRAAS